METTPVPGLCKATDLDMALGNSWCLDVSMVPGDSTGYPDQHGPGQARHGPWTLAWSEAANQATVIT